MFFLFAAKNGRNLALDDWMMTGCPMWMVCFCTSTSCTFVSFVELDWCYDAMISTFWRWKSVKLYLLAIVFKLLFSQACWMLLPCFWHQGCLAQKNDTAHTGGKFTARYWDVRPSTKEFPMPQGLMLNFTLSTHNYNNHVAQGQAYDVCLGRLILWCSSKDHGDNCDYKYFSSSNPDKQAKCYSTCMYSYKPQFAKWVVIKSHFMHLYASLYCTVHWV